MKKDKKVQVQSAMERFPVTVSGDGRRQRRAKVGNTEWVATERLDGTWELEQITPGPFVSGLAEDVAAAALDMVQAIAATLKRPHGAGPSTTCPECNRVVGIVRGAVAWHNEVAPGPGVDPVRCKGTGRPLEVPTNPTTTTTTTTTSPETSR